jgi:hypothetical protein
MKIARCRATNVHLRTCLSSMGTAANTDLTLIEPAAARPRYPVWVAVAVHAAVTVHPLIQPSAVAVLFNAASWSARSPSSLAPLQTRKCRLLTVISLPATKA